MSQQIIETKLTSHPAMPTNIFLSLVCGAEIPAEVSNEHLKLHVTSCPASWDWTPVDRPRSPPPTTESLQQRRQSPEPSAKRGRASLPCRSCNKVYVNTASFEKHRFFCDRTVNLAGMTTTLGNQFQSN